MSHPDLQPPFSRSLLLAPPTLSIAGELKECLATPLTTLFHRTLPITIKNGNTIIRSEEELAKCYSTELCPSRLDEITSWLWLAGISSSARALHRQQLLGREIVITEDPNEHLVWHQRRIFIKPLPLFLLDLTTWTQHLCKSPSLHRPSLGLLLSYAWLIRHQSDLRIAHEKGLLPPELDWPTWSFFINECLTHINLHSLEGVSPRYQYGELRLSRLDKICYVTRFSCRDFIRGYMTTPTWYSEFFPRNFRWMVVIFMVVSVALSAMQVALSTTRFTRTFEDASYGFAVASLFLTLGTAVVIWVVWAVLFTYHIVTTWVNHQSVMAARQKAAAS